MTTDAWTEPLSSNAKSANQQIILIALLITQFEASAVPSLILGNLYHTIGTGVYRLRDTNTQFWDIHLILEALRFNSTFHQTWPHSLYPCSLDPDSASLRARRWRARIPKAAGTD